VSLWWRWALGTSLGFLASLLLVEIGERSELGAIEGTLGGLMIGITQALILRQWFSKTWLWIFANAIAWGLMAGGGFGALGWVAPSTQLLGMRLAFGAWLGALGGSWLGIWQWLVLRQSVSASWRWIAIMLLSWSVALSLGWTLGGLLRDRTHLFLGEVLGLMVAWIIVGIMTGIALMGLLRQRKR
jgi:hypothetical protein